MPMWPWVVSTEAATPCLGRPSFSGHLPASLTVQQTAFFVQSTLADVWCGRSLGLNSDHSARGRQGPWSSVTRSEWGIFLEENPKAPICDTRLASYAKLGRESQWMGSRGLQGCSSAHRSLETLGTTGDGPQTKFNWRGCSWGIHVIVQE